jgi:hypothetical protein
MAKYDVKLKKMYATGNEFVSLKSDGGYIGRVSTKAANSTGLAVTAQEIDFSLKYDELQRYWRNVIAINPSLASRSNAIKRMNTPLASYISLQKFKLF